MNLNKNKLTVMRKELDELLNEFANKHGLACELGNITYDEDSFKLGLNFVKSTGMSPEESLFNQGLKKFPMFEGQFGKEYFINHERCIVYGINSRARTKPLLLKVKGSSNGKHYAISMDQLATLTLVG